MRCCCCCFCYFLRNLLFLCENCAAETKALLAHFPNKLTRIVNGSRVKGKINNWQCVCVSVIELVLVICCCAKFGLTREKSAYDWTSPRLMASIEAGLGRMSRQAWLRQQQRWRRRRRRQRLRWQVLWPFWAYLLLFFCWQWSVNHQCVHMHTQVWVWKCTNLLVCVCMQVLGTTLNTFLLFFVFLLLGYTKAELTMYTSNADVTCMINTTGAAATGYTRAWGPVCTLE